MMSWFDLQVQLLSTYLGLDHGG